MTAARHVCSGVSNATRGLVGGGFDPGVIDTIDYVTIASLEMVLILVIYQHRKEVQMGVHHQLVECGVVVLMLLTVLMQ